jgi:hypothetical protein
MLSSEAHLHAETVAEEGEKNVEGIHGDAIARPRRKHARRKIESMVAQSASRYFRETSKWRGLGNYLQSMIEYHGLWSPQTDLVQDYPTRTRHAMQQQYSVSESLLREACRSH